MFLKIFLWFWLAIAVIVGVLFAVTAVTRSEPLINIWRVIATEATGVYAASAAEVFERDGADGLQKYLERVANNSEVNAFVFNQNGEKIAFNGNENFEQARNLALKTRNSTETEFEVSPAAAMSARKVRLQSNENLILVVQMPRPRLAAMTIDAQTRLVRIIAVILAAGLVCYGLARYLTSPLRKLRAATQSFANGDFSVRVANKIGRRRDEITGLARDFDEMAARIENLVAAQKDLTTDISHELRSPLARLGVALEIARTKANPETQPSLDRIERESVRLNDMISQMLLLSKLESGTESIEKVRLDLSQLVQETIADADFEANSQNKSVKTLKNEKVFVRGETRLLQSAIENVVRNAVRHTPENTSVEVSLEKFNGNAVVTIRDFGAGVSTEELEKLFRPFYRVDFARERNAGGFGLGLAITERAVNAHGGTVKAENSPNSGLIITIKLKAEN